MTSTIIYYGFTDILPYTHSRASRMVSKFNHTHTIGDIRSFINASQPGGVARAYSLMTTFPNRTLDDLSKTLKDANVLGAVVVQKWD